MNYNLSQYPGPMSMSMYSDDYDQAVISLNQSLYEGVTL